MRRYTQAAVEMGKFLASIRKEKNLSMRHIARELGCEPIVISQTERGIIALKEPKIEAWAEALGVPAFSIRKEWLRLEALPVVPITRNQGKSTTKTELTAIFNRLTGPERDRVRGYIDHILGK